MLQARYKIGTILKKFIVPASLGAAAMLAMMAPASAANTVDDIRKCRQEISKDPAVEGAVLKFKSIKGARMKTLKFEMRDDEGKKMVVCKISRGAVQEIIWPV